MRVICALFLLDFRPLQARKQKWGGASAIESRWSQRTLLCPERAGAEVKNVLRHERAATAREAIICGAESILNNKVGPNLRCASRPKAIADAGGSVTESKFGSGRGLYDCVMMLTCLAIK